LFDVIKYSYVYAVIGVNRNLLWLPELELTLECTPIYGQSAGSSSWWEITNYERGDDPGREKFKL